MIKKNDWIFLISFAAYSYLFWQQIPGLNFFIMTCILVGGVILRDRTVLRNRAWLVAAGCALITSFSVFWHVNVLCVLANFASLLLVGSFVLNRGNSVIIAGLLGFANGITAIGFLFIAFVQRVGKTGSDRAGLGSKLKRVLIVLCMLIVVLLFFMLYRGSSLLFESLTDQINIDFISIPWLIFMLFGAIALYGFYRQQVYEPVASWDRNLPQRLTPSERKGIFDRLLSLDSEYFAGLVLLGMLNVMLFVVNGLDIAFLIGGSQFLPDDVTYSEYVHQGINQLILSIIFATAIILFWFRNYHAEGKQYKALKWLALLWVIQNMFMIAFTIYRNHSYIFVFGLTYKRIGVDVYLLLAMIGLALVIWKLVQQRSNSFVARAFGWACFLVLSLSAPIHWDRLIFNYNSSLGRRLDMAYMLELSNDILPELHNYRKPGYALTEREFNELHHQTFRFLSEQREMRLENAWPSMTINGHSAYTQLTQLPGLAKDSLVYAEGCDLDHVWFHPCYAEIRRLDLRGNQFESVGEIGQYKKLETLDLSYNAQLTSISGIRGCSNLKELNLEGTPVTDFSAIALMPQLRVLHVYGMSNEWKERLQLLNPQLEIR